MNQYAKRAVAQHCIIDHLTKLTTNYAAAQHSNIDHRRNSSAYGSRRSLQRNHGMPKLSKGHDTLTEEFMSLPDVFSTQSQVVRKSTALSRRFGQQSRNSADITVHTLTAHSNKGRNRLLVHSAVSESEKLCGKQTVHLGTAGSGKAPSSSNLVSSIARPHANFPAPKPTWM